MGEFLKTKKNFFFFFLSFFVNLLFAKTIPAPLWVTDIYSVYNADEYVAQLGTGENEEVAKSDALKNIANYLQTKVKSEGVSVRVVTKGENSNYSASAIQKITIQSEAELFGVEYDIYYHKKTKTYYCAAFINRKKYWAQMQPKIENLKHEFDNFYDEAERMLMSSEPILARKYFLFAQMSGQTFVDELYMARLIAGDMTKIFAKDEKKFFEINKNIKDSENAVAIFIETTGDYLNIVESKIKSIFENEKYNFTSDRKSCSHVMSVLIEQNRIVYNKGTEEEVTSITPSISITMINPYDNKNLFSYSRKAEKGVAYTAEVAMKRGYDNLCRKLENDLIESFQEKILEE